MPGRCYARVSRIVKFVSLAREGERHTRIFANVATNASRYRECTMQRSPVGLRTRTISITIHFSSSRWMLAESVSLSRAQNTPPVLDFPRDKLCIGSSGLNLATRHTHTHTRARARAPRIRDTIRRDSPETEKRKKLFSIGPANLFSSDRLRFFSYETTLATWRSDQHGC